MPGFDTGGVVYGLNVDFTGNSLTSGSAQVTSNGQLLIGSTAPPNIKVGNITSPLGTLNVSYNSPNIGVDLIGGFADLHVAKWIVNKTSNAGGNQTSIQAAISAASSGDTIFITPGIYVENLALKPGVNLCAFDCDALTPNVTIVGKCSLSIAGTVSISGIQLKTNSDNFLAVSGSSASIVYLKNCYLNASNNTGISYTTANAGAQIYVIDCFGNIGTTGITLISSSSTGFFKCINSFIDNTGATTTANSFSAGSTTFINTSINSPFAFSSTSGATFDNVIIQQLTNTTALTLTGTVTFNSFFGFYGSGSASAISVGAGTTLNIYKADISSSNTNAITGAGSIVYQSLTFSNTGVTINVTTQTGSGLLMGSTTTAPSAGFIGERITATRAQGSATTINNASKTITSITLTPGVWDISCLACLRGAVTGTAVQMSISTTTDTLAGNFGVDTIFSPTMSTGAADSTLTIAAFRAVVTTSTTYFLVGNATTSAGTATGYGSIWATRVG